MPVIIAVVMLAALISPAAAGCGFFGLYRCHYHHHHHRHHHHWHKTKIIVKKITIIKNRVIKDREHTSTQVAPIQPVK